MDALYLIWRRSNLTPDRPKSICYNLLTSGKISHLPSQWELDRTIADTNRPISTDSMSVLDNIWWWAWVLDLRRSRYNITPLPMEWYASHDVRRAWRRAPLPPPLVSNRLNSLCYWTVKNNHNGHDIIQQFVKLGSKRGRASNACTDTVRVPWSGGACIDVVHIYSFLGHAYINMYMAVGSWWWLLWMQLIARRMRASA